MKTTFTSLSLWMLAFGGPALAQAVHVVDTNGGSGFTHTTITAAVTAASDGDFILVRRGFYSEEVVLDGKGLTIQAETENGSIVGVERTIVQNLSSGQTAAIRGLRWDDDDQRLVLSNNAGVVWVEEGENGTPDSNDTWWGSIENCAHVVLRNCSFGSGHGGFSTTSFLELPGLTVTDSTVAIYTSNLVGEEGDLPSAGAPGLLVDGSQVTVYASNILGGRGSIGALGFSAGNGGPGIRVVGGGSVDLVGSTVVGGDPGTPGASGSGQMGPAYDVVEGALQELPNVARIFTSPSPLRSQVPTTLTFQGVPGDIAFVLVAPSPAPFSSFKQNVGPIVVPPSGSLIRIGRIPASGSLTVTAPAPSVASGVAQLFVQGIFLNAALPEVGIGTPTQVHVLDPTL
jgi:hypothetical protein